VANPVAAVMGGASLVGGVMQSRGAKRAARAQQQAADQSLQLQREMFNRQTELAEPFRQGGITSQNEMMRMLGLGGDPNSEGYGAVGRQFTAADMEMDPGYQFRLSEGLKSLDRTAAARGGMISGGALKAAGRYGQEFASGEFTNAFNRMRLLQADRLGALGTMYGAGQTATQQLSNQAGQFGVNAGNSMMDAGRARASGYIGSANAFSNALGQAAMGYGLAQGGYFNRVGGGGNAGSGGIPRTGSVNIAGLLGGP
jgi:hypothetical protein